MRIPLWCAVLTALLLTLPSGLAQNKRLGGKPGEINTPPAFAERVQSKIRAGDLAPDFTLADLHGKNKVALSSFRDKKPVVLIFGSAT